MAKIVAIIAFVAILAGLGVSYATGGLVRWSDAYVALEATEATAPARSGDDERLRLANATAEGEAPRGMPIGPRLHRVGTLAHLRYESLGAEGRVVSTTEVRALVPPLPYFGADAPAGILRGIECPRPCVDALAKAGGALLERGGATGIAAEWVMRMPVGTAYELGLTSFTLQDIQDARPIPLPQANYRVTLLEACPARVRVGAVTRLEFCIGPSGPKFPRTTRGRRSTSRSWCRRDAACFAARACCPRPRPARSRFVSRGMARRSRAPCRTLRRRVAKAVRGRSSRASREGPDRPCRRPRCPGILAASSHGSKRRVEQSRLEITFVSDVACPWCAIGLASIDRALERLGADVEASVRVEPFELNPDMRPEGEQVVPYLARKYGRTPEQVAQVQARIRDSGAAVGFTFGKREHVWNTFDAHRMLHWAGLEGRAVELKRELLRAYHGEGRNPGAHDVLVELAGKVGLDPARARAILESDEYADAVRERERFWMQGGVNGVPFVVVNGKYAIEGAQPPEAFEQAFRKIAQPSRA